MSEEVRMKGDWGVAPGDVVRMKKAHPCGGVLWRVVREGADVKIRCETCGRVVTLVRQEFLRRVKTVVSTTNEQEGNQN